MTRFVALLLATMLSLQLGWAAVGKYCEHETVPKGAQHFGHHAHEHESSHEADKADNDKNAGRAAFDSDCSFCYASTPATMASQQPRFPEIPLREAWVPPASNAHASALARAPDRPQWLRLA
jgi:hypothetical protein